VPITGIGTTVMIGAIALTGATRAIGTTTETATGNRAASETGDGGLKSDARTIATGERKSAATGMIGGAIALEGRSTTSGLPMPSAITATMDRAANARSPSPCSDRCE
jgi:hypothetical protein